jgi:translation initiation factor IF-2
MIKAKPSIQRSIGQKSILSPTQQLSIQKNTDSNWLKLKNPKIIYIGEDIDLLSLNKISNIADVSVDEINGPSFGRGEKKNKSHNKLIDPLESKKNKIKSKKKVRTKIHINDEDDNLETPYSTLSSSDRNLALSLMRPTRPAKKNIHSNINKRIPASGNTQVKITRDKNDRYKSHKDLVVVKPTQVILSSPISIDKLSRVLAVPAPEIIKSLFLKGISVTINQIVDSKIAQAVAEDYGISIEEDVQQDRFNQKSNAPKYDSSPTLLPQRSPIVTILGHVDHGKTTLLHTIRQTQHNTIEAGGITQSIMAYEVQVEHNENTCKIIFLDTPGHQAFSSMRARGMQVTDVAVIVVAADDELQSQSIETIQYLQKYQVPFIVAINKIDKESVDVASLKRSFKSLGIIDKNNGGNTYIIEVSALQKQNIDQLLKTILYVASQQTLLANPLSSGSGTILDSYLDKKQGPVANILVQDGTVKVGDFISNETMFAKVRSMVGQDFQKYEKAGPSSVVKVSGLSSIPRSGSLFNVINNSKTLKKQLSEQQKNKDKAIKSYTTMHTRISFDTINNSKDKALQKQVNIILKTDSEGTIEALISAFENIPQEKVQLNLVSLGVGDITSSDIALASVSNSILIGFNNKISSKTQILATKANIIIAEFKIIYDLIEFIEKVMLEFVEVDYAENIIGQAIVETVFAVSKGNVAGCIVTYGKLKRGCYLRVKRSTELMYNGKLNSLKRVKDDVEEVNSGNECGVLCQKFDLWQKKDEIEAYELIEIIKTL